MLKVDLKENQWVALLANEFHWDLMVAWLVWKLENLLDDQKVDLLAQLMEYLLAYQLDSLTVHQLEHLLVHLTVMLSAVLTGNWLVLPTDCWMVCLLEPLLDGLQVNNLVILMDF